MSDRTSSYAKYNSSSKGRARTARQQAKRAAQAAFARRLRAALHPWLLSVARRGAVLPDDLRALVALIDVASRAASAAADRLVEQDPVRPQV